jgi:hypothetical protein
MQRLRYAAPGQFIPDSRMENMPGPDASQIALKPQDLLVLFALLSHEGGTASYPELAAQTGLASSAAHGAVKRAVLAGLASVRNRRPVVLRPPLREFVRFGARYAFPAIHGRLTRGVPTAHAAAPLNAQITPSADPPPVWPHKRGEVRGVALTPLYPTAPDAAQRDSRLYERLALFDAIRSGQAREREIAQKQLAARI